MLRKKERKTGGKIKTGGLSIGPPFFVDDVHKPFNASIDNIL
ncbi:hypothetical protein B4100_2236 [Heyndrickxia coagulans]|uniref:Uncharacterized protein n=1 Tax=Heyndrickxia coagulans TaxID=1398 RepID=A0A150K6P4_HEYCO|nr:hypothetical protein B4099_2219 [Heyndrickxia coagulans]KYC65170.1 hypothetical protein B4100_2236 [Heyndrickxia coagulans]